MKKRLMDFLCCPICKGDLELDTTDDDVVTQGRLKCGPCTKEWPIEHGVPDFTGHDISATKRNFMMQWKLKAKGYFEPDGLTYNFNNRSVARSLLTHLLPETDGKVVLDAGCGAGRHIEAIADLARDAEAIGVDFAIIPENADRIQKQHANLHYIKASISELPLRDDVIDFVYCQGVLHHMKHQPPLSGMTNGISSLVPPRGICWISAGSQPASAEPPSLSSPREKSMSDPSVTTWGTLGGGGDDGGAGESSSAFASNGTTTVSGSSIIREITALLDTAYGKPLSLISGGFEKILDFMRENVGAKVRFSEPVRRIEWNDSTQTVITDKGKMETDRVIITVPVSVLQAGNIEFVPELPSSKQDSIAALGMGDYGKLFLKFDEQFWQKGLDALSPCS